MSRGLGKLERICLELLKGECRIGGLTPVRALDAMYEGTNYQPSRTDQSAVCRALSSLERKGLIYQGLGRRYHAVQK